LIGLTRRSVSVSLQAASAEAFVEILRDAGVPVTIVGKDYQAMVSSS